MFEYCVIPELHTHRYYLFSTGTGLKAKYYDTRSAAEQAMYQYCADNGIHIECSEYDKHERKFTNHNGIRFYINRV